MKEELYNSTVYPYVIFFQLVFTPLANFNKCDWGRSLRGWATERRERTELMSYGKGKVRGRCELCDSPSQWRQGRQKHHSAAHPVAQIQAQDFLANDADGQGGKIGGKEEE